MAKTPAWTRKEGKNPKGGLNAKGRASYNRANPGKQGLKAPQPEGGPRRDSLRPDVRIEEKTYIREDSQ
jgi:hypothetical protein